MIYEHHKEWDFPHVIKIHVAFEAIGLGPDALRFMTSLKQLTDQEFPHLSNLDVSVMDIDHMNYFAARHIERRYGEHLSQFDPCGLRVRIVEPLNKDDFRWVNICFKSKADAMLFKLTFGGE